MLVEIFNFIMNWLTNLIEQVGYFGIFVGMFLESTIIPIPSEIIMIPAGISASKGGMNSFLAISFGVFGNVLGAIFSYYLAKYLGRAILFRIGKYFFIKAETIIKIEGYFNKHGSISVFLGRLIPGFRHFISLPAGIAKMDFKLFCIYTTIGSAIWTSILFYLGYFIGNNQELIKEYLHLFLIGCLVVCTAIIVFYIFLKPARQ